MDASSVSVKEEAKDCGRLTSQSTDMEAEDGGVYTGDDHLELDWGLYWLLSLISTEASVRRSTLT